MTTITHNSGVISPTLVDGYRTARTPRSILHPILGRSDDDVTFRPPSLRKGTLTLVFASEAPAKAAADALLIPQVFTLYDPDIDIDMSFVVAEEDLQPELDDATRKVWIVTTPYREVLP